MWAESLVLHDATLKSLVSATISPVLLVRAIQGRFCLWHRLRPYLVFGMDTRISIGSPWGNVYTLFPTFTSLLLTFLLNVRK